MKQESSKKGLITAAVVIIFVVLAYLIASEQKHAGEEASYEDMNGGWEIAVDGEVIGGDSLFDLEQYLGDQRIYSGMKIRMTREIFVEESVQVPTVTFKNQDCAYQVIYDNKEIKADYFDRLIHHKFIGGDVQYVALPQESGMHEINIWLYIERDGGALYIDNIRFGSYEKLEHAFVKDRLFAMINGIFLIVFGGIFSFIALLFYGMMPEMKAQLYSALMCTTLGVWIHHYYNVMGYIADGTHTRMVMIILAYVFVPLSCLLLKAIHQETFTKSAKALSLVILVLSAVLILLHLLNWQHIRGLLYIYFVLCIIALGMVIRYYIKDLKDQGERNITNWMQMNGLLVLDVGLMIGLCMVLAKDSFILLPKELFYNYFPMLGLVYACIQLMIYLTSVTESYAHRQETVSLSHLAYADGLTDLANRARCDEYMEILDQQSNASYCVISLDVNGLKEVNDKLGHTAGDRLLRDFSGVLKKCFGDDGFVSRIGGDEFVVIIQNTDEARVELLLRRMNEALHAMNVIYAQYYRSAAYGYAFNNECESGKAHDVYMLADQRMYELKHKQHLKLKLQDRV
ncbi:MAG: GGDEF domain-containing protein [Lachnospiraceae bacterium]|nr:GGDEF domain-containing protein [Lachnospiraceae bacterium]